MEKWTGRPRPGRVWIRCWFHQRRIDLLETRIWNWLKSAPLQALEVSRGAILLAKIAAARTATSSVVDPPPPPGSPSQVCGGGHLLADPEISKNFVEETKFL